MDQMNQGGMCKCPHHKVVPVALILIGLSFLLNALGMLRSRARAHLEAFEALIARVPAAARPAFLPVALVPGYLAAMERPDYDPFRTAIDVPQWRRQWTLWRAARHGR